MPTILPLQFTEVGRTKLCVVLGTLNWLCILASIVLIGCGAYIKMSLNEYTYLVENYDDDSVPFTLIGSGIIAMVFCCLGGALYFFNHDPSNRGLLVTLFYLYLALDGVLIICILTAAILCYAHIDNLQSAFHGGLQSAMADYKHDKVIKVEMDDLQIEFKCCGSQKYTDWFRIDWMLDEFKDDFTYGVPKYVPKNLSYVHDSTPFSCCNPNAQRPCINVDILEDGRYTDYHASNGSTLYEDGCLENLMDFFGEKVLVNIGAIAFLIFAFKLVIFLLTRILQTSILTTLNKEDPLGPSVGYLIQWGNDEEQVPDENCPRRNGQGELVRSVSQDDLQNDCTYIKTQDLQSQRRSTVPQVNSQNLYLNDC